MESCTRHALEPVQIKKTFQGHARAFGVEGCRSCGAHAWTPGHQRDFQEWIGTLYQKNPKDFYVQFLISETAHERVADWVDRMPGTDEALIFRALIGLYLDVVSVDASLYALVESVTETPAFEALDAGPKKRMNVLMKPTLHMDVMTLSTMSEMKVSEACREALYRMIALAGHARGDGPLSDLWEGRLKGLFGLVCKVC